ncbi:pilus assembly protein [Desulfosediminicola ganghwensis]|uniref:pilus assembly protein n=1 Tax=Desulfosediminicola ganghwensis TaxID=2569540 RepID=UPI0010ABF917|nr:hypothetical protein [Desulfosediminicola ganghwensis]
MITIISTLTITKKLHKFVLLTLLLPVNVYAAQCSDYFAIPPFLISSVKPNVVFMLDSSGSMKEPQYPGGYSKDCTGNCIGDDFDPAKEYFGLFRNDQTYSYDSTIPVDTTELTGATANYDVIVDTSSTGAFYQENCAITQGVECWSGNFLNWLTTRKIDVARKVLTGGKVENRAGFDYMGTIPSSFDSTTFKIVGHNEPSDHSIFKYSASSENYSPYPNSTIFQTMSPAHAGELKASYDPYAKLVAGSRLILNSAGEVIGEYGLIEDLHDVPVTVNFQTNYPSPPVIIAKTPSDNGSDPSIVQVILNNPAQPDSSENTSSFKIRIQEWGQGQHIIGEKVAYLAIRKGTHLLLGDNGPLRLVAGSQQINHIDSWQKIETSGFTNQPVVFTSIVTAETSNPVTTRVQNVLPEGFETLLQTNALNQKHNQAEIVHFLAIEDGTFHAGDSTFMISSIGNISGTNQNLWLGSQSPELFIADMQTSNDNTTASLRYQLNPDDSIDLHVENADGSITHSSETSGFIAIDQAHQEYNIAVIVDEEPQGVIQKLADNSSDEAKIRAGLSFFRYHKDENIYEGEWAHGGTLNLAIPKNPFVKHTNDTGGFRYINTPVTAPAEDLVDAIEHYPLVWGTTPLAENLFSLGQYFAQEQSPYYIDKPAIANDIIYEAIDSWDPYAYEQGDGSYNIVRCAKSYVIILTDGHPSKDDYIPPMFLDSFGNTQPIIDSDGDNNIGDGSDAADESNIYQDNLDDIAYFLRWDDSSGQKENRDLRFDADLDGDQYITTYSVTFGSNTPPQILQDAAANGGGQSYSASSGDELANVLTKAVSDILARTSAGTAVSVLSERAASGALISQALFFPEKQFADNSSLHNVQWLSNLSGYWHYRSDSVSSIRENTTDTIHLDPITNDTYFALDIIDDMAIEFVLSNDGTLVIERYNPISTMGNDYGDKDPNSAPGNTPGPYDVLTAVDQVQRIFDTGEILSLETIEPDLSDILGGGRLIFGVDRNGTQTEFLQSNRADFAEMFKLGTESTPSCLGDPLAPETVDNLISYIRGASDNFTVNGAATQCRSRRFRGDSSLTATSDEIWKLGDIINSTPRIVDYPDYSVLYTGANDGMLHAFKIGKLRKDMVQANQAIALCNNNDDGFGCLNDEIGEELWSFIPQNVMPYLQFLADPDYEHIYTVDQSPYVITTADKKILIGGMRFGGAVGCTDGTGWCGDTTGTIGNDNDSNPYQAIPPEATIIEMQDPNGQFITVPAGGTNIYSPALPGNLGLSSYFAIDITDANDPKFLWEFTDPKLGYSYSGPAYIKRGSKHYVLFLSGPLNSNGRATDGQELSVFILQLKDDFSFDQLHTITATDNPNFQHLNKAFGGRLFTNGVDYNGDDNTDAVFFGVNWITSGDWKGNVFLVAPDDGDPSQWDIQQVLNQAIAPITAAIGYGYCNKKNYIYFGTGRWFYRDDMAGGQNDTNSLLGVQIDNCLQDYIDGVNNPNCSFNNSHSTQSGSDVCGDRLSGALTWNYNELDTADGIYNRERTITDPTIIDDFVIFTTMKPYANSCYFGGVTRLYGFNCETGHDMWHDCTSTPVSPPAASALLQPSGGNIINIELTEENFIDGDDDPDTLKVRTDTHEGTPPEDATETNKDSGYKGELLLWIER